MLTAGCGCPWSEAEQMPLGYIPPYSLFVCIMNDHVHTYRFASYIPVRVRHIRFESQGVTGADTKTLVSSNDFHITGKDRKKLFCSSHMGLCLQKSVRFYLDHVTFELCILLKRKRRPIDIAAFVFCKRSYFTCFNQQMGCIMRVYQRCK